MEALGYKKAKLLPPASSHRGWGRAPLAPKPEGPGQTQACAALCWASLPMAVPGLRTRGKPRQGQPQRARAGPRGLWRAGDLKVTPHAGSWLVLSPWTWGSWHASLVPLTPYGYRLAFPALSLLPWGLREIQLPPGVALALSFPGGAAVPCCFLWDVPCHQLVCPPLPPAPIFSPEQSSRCRPTPSGKSPSPAFRLFRPPCSQSERICGLVMLPV